MRVGWKCALVLAVILGSTAVIAQRRPLGQQAQTVTLTIRFYMAKGAVMPTQVMVELFTTSGNRIDSSPIDSSGQVRFANLGEGNFALRVSGAQIESNTYTFTIFGNEPQQFETFELKPATNATAGATNIPTVGTDALGVPANAKKEVDKAGEALKRGDWKEVQKHCEKAIEIYPQYTAAYNNLGVALIKTGERAKARKALNHAVELDPKYARPYVNLARMDVADKNYAEAEALLKKAIDAQPEDAEALFLLSNAELENGHYDDAIASARKVHGLPHQGFEGAHVVCAMALAAENRNSEAADEYRVFLSEAPNSSMAPQARAALAELEKTSKN